MKSIIVTYPIDFAFLFAYCGWKVQQSSMPVEIRKWSNELVRWIARSWLLL